MMQMKSTSGFQLWVATGTGAKVTTLLGGRELGLMKLANGLMQLLGHREETGSEMIQCVLMQLATNPKENPQVHLLLTR